MPSSDQRDVQETERYKKLEHLPQFAWCTLCGCVVGDRTIHEKYFHA